MNCEQARQLFDAYLDGELSAPLATELGAHRVRCAECRRALALLEVTGHIISSDDEPVSLGEGFSERLLACMDAPAVRWVGGVRRVAYGAGLLAAAAVIALAFLGFFDGGSIRVAGQKEYRRGGPRIVDTPSLVADPLVDTLPMGGQDAREGALERWFEQTEQNLARKRESGESLEKALDLTILQLLDILNEAKEESSGADHFPGADATVPTAPEGDVPDSEEAENH